MMNLFTVAISITIKGISKEMSHEAAGFLAVEWSDILGRIRAEQ